MLKTSLDDTDASAIEVRIDRDEQLIARELCESEDDILAPEPADVADEDDPIADAPVPDRGWE